jgi:hypothetical protein
MSELSRNTTQTRRPRPPPERAAVEAIRDCLAPIMTCTLIARSVCDDRRARLALEIIERQTHQLTHLLQEAYGLDLRPRFD